MAKGGKAPIRKGKKAERELKQLLEEQTGYTFRITFWQPDEGPDLVSQDLVPAIYIWIKRLKRLSIKQSWLKQMDSWQPEAKGDRILAMRQDWGEWFILQPIDSYMKDL